jgi:hypothetical protein
MTFRITGTRGVRCVASLCTLNYSNCFYRRRDTSSGESGATQILEYHGRREWASPCVCDLSCRVWEEQDHDDGEPRPQSMFPFTNLVTRSRLTRLKVRVLCSRD